MGSIIRELLNRGFKRGTVEFDRERREIKKLKNRIRYAAISKNFKRYRGNMNRQIETLLFMLVAFIIGFAMRYFTASNLQEVNIKHPCVKYLKQDNLGAFYHENTTCFVFPETEIGK